MSTETQYWKEALQSSLDELGKSELLTSDEYNKVAKDLELAREMMGMAFGWENIPNPLSDTVRNLELKVKAKEKEAAEWRESFAQNVMARRNVERSEVEVNKDGTATIWRDGPTI